MDKLQKDALQATKEIVVKFIETGRISPANFAEIFPEIYSVVLRTIQSDHASPEVDSQDSSSASS